MKKVTKSREFNPVEENQPIESSYQKDEKHSLIKSFTQKADQNIKKTKTEEAECSEINKSKKEEYVEKPAEDVKPAKGKYVKVKKSFGKVAPIEKGGPKKFSTERPNAGVPKREQKVAKTEEKEKGCGMKYKKMMDYMKKKSIEEGIGENTIIKSLDAINPETISEEQFSVFEKACISLDPMALMEWVDSMVSAGANVAIVDITEETSEKSEDTNEVSKFEQFVKQLTEKAIEAGIEDSPIVKSLSDMDSENINDAEMLELEKAYIDQDVTALVEWINRKKTEKSKGKKFDAIKDDIEEVEEGVEELEENSKKETKKSMKLPKVNKSLNSTSGQGGDLTIPQLAGQKKKLVKVKKSVDSKSFFVQSDCQKA